MRRSDLLFYNRPRWILIFCSLPLVFARGQDFSSVEDITSESSKFDSFPTPPPIEHPKVTISEKAKKAMLNQYARKNVIEKTQNFQIFNEQDLVGQTKDSPYSKRGRTRKEGPEGVARDSSDQRQVVAGIPDLSDPCFRRYANCIIVNAQPYERRSSMGPLQCKAQCINSQSGLYSCRSFVYDNINRVCDLFAHVGDQAPARLLKFQSRDYFEPTNALQCLSLTQSENPDVEPPSPPPEDFTSDPIPIARASNTDQREKLSEPIRPETILSADMNLVAQSSNKTSTAAVPTTTGHQSLGKQCPRGRQSRFLRTEGFELFNHDDEQLEVSDVGQCTKACTDNEVNGRQLDCKSFDFSGSTCSFTEEAAVPVGNGQLKQKQGAYYYEKICVDESFVASCKSSFSRFPQMILVGFAESVTDSPSFEHCFDACLNSLQLFGFNCSSGMYYFEEAQLNCILNSESRHSQKDLFTEENTDIVDYFEVACESQPRVAGVKTFESPVISSEKLILAPETEIEWSDCIEGMQHRRRQCAKKTSCGMEARACGDAVDVRQKDIEKDSNRIEVPTREEISAVKAKIRRDGLKCPLNTCCRVFLSCNFGLRHNSTTKKLEWCRNPCATHRRQLV